MKEGDSETDQQAAMKDQEYRVRMQQSRGRNSTKDSEGDMIQSRTMDR